MLREIITHAAAYITAHYIELIVASVIGSALALAPKEVGVAKPPVVRERPAPAHVSPLIRVNLD
jgi:hypothetical protein